jgi:hypothetical protein
MHVIIVAVGLVGVVCYAADEQKSDVQKQVTLKDLNELAFEKYLEKHPEILGKLETKKDASLEEKLKTVPDQALVLAMNGCAQQ